MWLYWRFITAIQKLHAQQAKLDELESEWKVKEMQMLAEIKQREAEIKWQLKKEKNNLQQLQVDSEVKVAANCVMAYNNFDVLESCIEDADIKTPLCSTEYKPFLNLEAMLFELQHAAPGGTTAQEKASLTQAIANSFTWSRPPISEPTFTGDSLKSIDWNVSFMALID